MHREPQTAAHRRSAVEFAGASRVHIGLEVADLERSIAFYQVLFGEGPVKVRPGYAKFEPREPSVNLSLNHGAGGHAGRAGGSQHFGVQVQSSEGVRSMVARFHAAGIPTRSEQDSACCYSVQDKVWAEDPDGNPWEVFVVVQADAPQRAPSGSSCCAPLPSGASQTGPSSCCGGA